MPQQTRATVDKLADAIAKGDKVDETAATFFKGNKDKLKETMWVFKPRQKDGKGGIGIGEKPGVYTPDGIEGIILTYGNPRRQALRAPELKVYTEDFLRLADVTLAMAEITDKYVPQKAVGAKTPAAWSAANDDMKKAALQLKDAIKARNSADVKKAFGAIGASCIRCHDIFGN